MTKLNQRKDVTAEILVGAFILTILAVLLVITVVISQNRFFEKSYSLTASFPTVGGLREGEEVFLRGVKIGFVENMEFDAEENGVYVDMKLTRQVILYEGYDISVEVASMLGGMRIMISQGDPDAPRIPESEFSNLEGTPPQNVLKIATEAVQEIRSSLLDSGTLDNFNTLSENLASISTKIANGEGTIGKLITEDRLYREAEGLVASLNRTSADLEAIAKRVNEGEGTLGRLLDAEDTLYEDLQETIASLKTFSEDLAAQQGSVGRLIRDDTLYIKVESLVDEARATIDDFRETSPITTFSSIFFGAF
jgi:phospholipid/cholesterol/gamma-HCH transport system substrate-binding protein